MTLTTFQKECLQKASKGGKIEDNRTSKSLQRLGLLDKKLRITDNGKKALEQTTVYFHL